MSAASQLETVAAQTLQRAPRLFIIAATLALLSAIWVHPPVTFLSVSIVSGGVGMVLLAFAWRLRSFVAVVTAYSLIGGSLASGVRTTPNLLAFLSLFQGLCVCIAVMSLLLWIFRRRLQAFCRLKNGAAGNAPAPNPIPSHGERVDL